MDQLTLSLEEVHVNRSQSQEEGSLLMESRDSCLSILERLTNSDQNGLFGKMYQEHSLPKDRKARKAELSKPCSQPWLNSGMVSHGECWTLNTSEWPKDADVCFLSDVLETQNVPERFYLSKAACQGILNRAERRGKKLPDQLKAALEEVVYGQ